MKITLDQTQLSGLVDAWPYQNNTMQQLKARSCTGMTTAAEKFI